MAGEAKVGNPGKRPTINVGGNLILTLPPDCKVLSQGGRVLIEAPTPSYKASDTPAATREQIGKAIWFAMVAKPLEPGQDWTKTGAGRRALSYADSVVRLLEGR